MAIPPYHQEQGQRATPPETQPPQGSATTDTTKPSIAPRPGYHPSPLSSRHIQPLNHSPLACHHQLMATRDTLEQQQLLATSLDALDKLSKGEPCEAEEFTLSYRKPNGEVIRLFPPAELMDKFMSERAPNIRNQLQQTIKPYVDSGFASKTDIIHERLVRAESELGLSKERLLRENIPEPPSPSPLSAFPLGNIPLDIIDIIDFQDDQPMLPRKVSPYPRKEWPGHDPDGTFILENSWPPVQSKTREPSPSEASFSSHNSDDSLERQTDDGHRTHAAATITPIWTAPNGRNFLDLAKEITEVYATTGYQAAGVSETVEISDSIPRPHHGAQHQARVAMWSLVVLQELREHGIPEAINFPDKDIPLVMLACLFHDSGRQGEGPDQKAWEAASAEKCKAFMIKQGFSEEDATICANAIRFKDDYRRLPQTSDRAKVVQWLLHLADGLDVIRVREKGAFNPTYLYDAPELQSYIDGNDFSQLADCAEKVINAQGDLHRSREGHFDMEKKKAFEWCPNPLLKQFEFLSHQEGALYGKIAPLMGPLVYGI